MSEFFTINYNGVDVKVTPVQGGQDLYYMVELPGGTKMLEFQLEEDQPAAAFTDEGVTEESLDIWKLIEEKED